MTTKKFVCADCGHHQDTMTPCEECQSYRVILVSVAIEQFGTDYMDCFDEEGNEKT